ncbi:biotin--[acetyl-CoA-carboxylase] ligase [Moraxella nasibovis]|uniref:biotin--[acetyl-CoA-carboxylase] ligase n=1 Tax=Moraxella nasibovis TaxID=2904120 RepID=UPI00240EF6FF|nr:biotin--[acetyl-CoA-carboxylase] ligase [Moraxella nasibovis]WFF38179.1 biotin--[acetyl-CoA-carboxylase] ligase [Moraxella nasibovis]
MHDLLAHTHFDETDSTNTQLINAISTGTLPHATPHLYTANHQTAGRGQHGRSWVSGMDNVFLSLYIPIGQDERQLHRLSGLLSLAVGFELAQLKIIQAINQIRTQNQLPLIGVKWANDVGFYDERLGVFQKLSGILIEPVFKKLPKNTLVGVVIGIGLNVNNSPIIQDGLYQATCLKELIPNDDLSLFVRPEPTKDKKTIHGSTSSPRTDFSHLSAQALYMPMANAIFKAVQICNGLNNEMTIKKFITDFNKSHLLQGKWIDIFIQNNMTDIHASGLCVGIGGDGELLLENNHQITPIYAGMAKIQGKVQ